jgi:hypothetical protein
VASVSAETVHSEAASRSAVVSEPVPNGSDSGELQLKVVTLWTVSIVWRSETGSVCMGLGAFAASELDKVFSGYQPR